MNPIFNLLIVSLIPVFLFPGCAPKKETLPVSASRIDSPFQRYDGASIVSYAGEYKRWRLDADYMRKPLDDTGKVVVVPVHLTIYDSLGRPSSKVVSDSGSTTARVEVLNVWGNVLVKTAKGMTIRSQKLWWNRQARRVYSDTYVEVETEKGDILKGKGLDATEDFSRFSFKSNAYTRVPDFKRRIESDDTTFLE